MKALTSILLASTFLVAACGESDAEKARRNLMQFDKKMDLPTLAPGPVQPLGTLPPQEPSATADAVKKEQTKKEQAKLMTFSKKMPMPTN